jgi:hypothetical protein
MALPAFVHEQIAERQARLRLVPSDESPPPETVYLHLSVEPASATTTFGAVPAVASDESREQLQRWREHVQQTADTIRWVDDLIARLEAEPELTRPERDVLAHARDGRAQAFELMQRINPAQAWFWSEAWQAKEREADADEAAGRTTFHASGEDFLAALDAHLDDADA